MLIVIFHDTLGALILEYDYENSNQTNIASRFAVMYGQPPSKPSDMKKRNLGVQIPVKKSAFQFDPELKEKIEDMERRAAL